MRTLPQPDPTACCPDAYWCPTDDGQGETECPRHGGFNICCDKPELHVPMDRAAWHQAQERLERAALDEHISGRPITA